MNDTHLSDQPQTAESLNATGIARYEEGNYVAAMRCFERATRLDPTCAEAWNNRGLLLAQYLKLDKAEECFRRAIALDGEYILARVNRSRLYLQRGDAQKAMEELTAALRAEHGDPEDVAVAVYNRAQLRQRQNNWTGAVKDYDFVLHISPQMAPAWLGRSIARLQLGDASGALSDADETLRRLPEEQSASAFHARGGARSKLRDFGGALQDYNRAIHLNPEFVEAYVSRGNARYHLRDVAGFLDYRMAFRIHPGRAAEELARILIGDAEENASEVLANCDQHLRINPRDFTAHVRRALTLGLLGRPSEGQADLDQACELVPDAPGYVAMVIEAIRSRED
jgi:tetratricopeptide (TPR) repeat protein